MGAWRRQEEHQRNNDLENQRVPDFRFAAEARWKLFIGWAAELAELALRHRLPAIFVFPQFTAAGGLMSYSTSLSDHYRIAGLYTARVLKGEKPSDLPVYQDTKIELIVNMKTAKALDLTLPPTLFALADEVME